MADQASASGYGKSAAAVGAGAASTILAYIVEQVIEHPLPAEQVAAVQTLITLGAVYLTPHSAVGGGS